MKQTAVEWLWDMLLKAEFINNPEELLTQAKEMEKEQIIESFSYGVINHHDAFKNQNKFGNGQQYYNETFKSE